MPKVPTIDWFKMPYTSEPKRKVALAKPRIKRHKKKKSKSKIVDKRLFNDIYDQDQHLKSI